MKIIPSIFVQFLVSSIWTYSSGQKLNYITYHPSYQLEAGEMLYDDGNIMFTGDLRDTNGYIGYYIGRLETAGQLSCFNYYLDSLRVKRLVFAPSVKIDDHVYASMGFAWRKSRPMLVVYNDQCDTLFTREYKVKPDDSLSYQVMEDMVKVPGVGYAIIGQLMAYRSRDTTRSQIFVMLLDEEFNEIWQTQYGDQHDDYAIRAEFMEPDTLLIFGLESIGVFTWPPVTWSQYLKVMKISLHDGSLLWNKKDIPPDRSGDFGFVRTPENGFILCAAELIDSFYANGHPGNYYPQNSIFDFNSDFEITWEVQYGELSQVYDKYTDIVKSIDNDGAVAIGTVRNFEDTLGYLTVVTKVSWTGDSIWTRYYQPVHENPKVLYTSANSSFDQIVSTENGYILQADVRLDTLASEYPYRDQTWFLELDRFGCHIPGCHLVSSEADLQRPDSTIAFLNVYPNPARDWLTAQIKGDAAQITDISVWDAQGSMRMSAKVMREDTQYLISTSHLSPGSYTLVASRHGIPIISTSFIKVE